MFYDFSFTIPANTARDDPEIWDLKLTHGVAHRVEIGFPKGCAGLAHLVARQGLHQVWPTNPDGSFNADDYTIAFNDYQPLKTEPYILTLVGWSFDDTFPHTLEVRIGILPAWILLPEEIFVQAFKRLLKRLRL